MQHGHALLLEALKKRRGGWLSKPGIRMLEIGTTREPLPTQDSTRILSEFCRDHGWHFTTCDMDPANTASAQAMFDKLGVPFTAVTAKGEEYVTDPNHVFEVVYLDAYDFDHGQHSEERQQRYEEHLGARIDQQACEVMHLEAMQGLTATAPPRCLVVIDDTWQDHDGRWLGKGPLAVPWALENGWTIKMPNYGYRAVALEKRKDTAIERPATRRSRFRRRTRTVPAAAPPAPVSPTPRMPDTWSRDAAFGPSFTPRAITDIVAPVPPVAWVSENPRSGVDRAELLDEVARQHKWRHHHGLDEIRQGGELYQTYSDRVDALLALLDRALFLAGVDLSTSSVLDIGAAEGYVANHLLSAGATDVDLIELNESNIDRIWLIQALKGTSGARVGRVDLDLAHWAGALGRSYDVTLALGVIYHMENPLLFARNLYSITDGVAVIESDTPVLPDNARFRGHGALHLNRDQVTLAPGDVRYLTEMRPDRLALAELLLSAGFRHVSVVEATGPTSRYFRTGEKTVMLAER